MKYALLKTRISNSELTKTVLIKCTQLPDTKEAIVFLRKYGDVDYWTNENLIIEAIEEVSLDYENSMYDLSDIYKWPTFSPTINKPLDIQNITVLDLALLLDDNINVVILNQENVELAKYNGKDSIDEQYNDKIVLQMIPKWELKELYLVV